MEIGFKLSDPIMCTCTCIINLRSSICLSEIDFRVIDTAAVCVQNSLGFTFLHPSREEMEVLDNAKPADEEEGAVDNEDPFNTTSGGMTFPVARRHQLEATKKISRSNTLTSAPIVMLEDEDYPQAGGFNKTIVRIILQLFT